MDQTVVIRLELHLADDSIRGRASDATGAAREFAGWVGLVAAIDALVNGSTPESGETPSINPLDDGETA